MEKSEIEKRNQTIEDVFGELQTYLIGKLPMGAEFNLLFNVRNNIRKERLLRFFEGFRDELQRVYGKPLDEDTIKSEQFIDVMEAIIIRVQSTQSSYKVERFRNILLRQAINPIEHQLTLKFVQIIDELTDIQMIMLNVVMQHNRRTIKGHSDLVTLIWKEYNSNLNIEEFRHEDFTINQSKSDIFVSYKEVKFYLADLVNKGLIENTAEDELSIPNMKYNSWPSGSNQRVNVQRKKKDSYSITELGKVLIEFVKNQD